MLHKASLFQGEVTFPRAERLLNNIIQTQVIYRNPHKGPLVLYGKGNLGKLATDYFKRIGKPVNGHIDKSSLEIPRHAITAPHIAVCVVTEPYCPIEKSLWQKGYIHISSFYDTCEEFRHLHPLANGWHAGAINSNTFDVLAKWGDNVSRAHHLMFIAWRRLREEWSFEKAPVCPSERYCIPEIQSSINNETFLDVGAHTGQSSMAFRGLCGGRYRFIIAVEPDPDNFKVMKSNLENNLNVIMLTHVLDDGERLKQFYDGLGYCSQLSTLGHRMVRTCTIDSMNVDPTFVKIHTEGNELAVLKGGKHTLQKYRPIVAATVYHNADGIWETPMWLMENLPDYKFLFRNHGWCGTGAVVYAIPKERL